MKTNKFNVGLSSNNDLHFANKWSVITFFHASSFRDFKLMYQPRLDVCIHLVCYST